MTLNGGDYARLTCLFYDGMRESFESNTDVRNHRAGILYGVSSGTFYVWYCGWHDEPLAPHVKNGSDAMRLSGLDPDSLEAMYYTCLKDGYAATTGVQADPELIHKASLQYALARIYEAGRMCARKAAIAEQEE